MTTIEEGERVKPSLFRNMQTSYKKEEIFVLKNEKKGGKQKTKQKLMKWQHNFIKSYGKIDEHLKTSMKEKDQDSLKK